MLSTVLNSGQAIRVNIAIMRTFVKLRDLVHAHKEIASRLQELEQKFGSHDIQIRSIFEAIRELMKPPEKPKKPIGFQVKEHPPKYRGATA